MTNELLKAERIAAVRVACDGGTVGVELTGKSGATLTFAGNPDEIGAMITVILNFTSGWATSQGITLPKPIPSDVGPLTIATPSELGLGASPDDPHNALLLAAFGPILLGFRQTTKRFAQVLSALPKAVQVTTPSTGPKQ